MPCLLTAALIVRDEESVLEQCLRAAKQVADELVVVDTGSTDSSREIALGMGAVVLEFPWTGHFSDARNTALDAATGEWILYLDADEEIEVEDPAAFRAVLENGSRNLAFRPLLKSRSNWTPYREFRVFRNRADLRFRGVMHETIVPDIERILFAERLLISPINALIRHSGYDGDQTHKHARDLPLLMIELQQTPDRAYLWDHVGRIHEALGDRVAAEGAWQQGVQVVRESGSALAVDGLPYGNLLSLRVMLGRPDLALAREAIARFPGNPVLLWAGAETAFALKQWRQAVDWIDALLNLDRDAIADEAVAIDESLIGHVAHDARGQALFELGHYLEAATAFSVAEALAPEEPAYRVRRQLASARAKSAQ